MVIVALAPLFQSAAQETCKRLMTQDTSLNNLIDPPGYETCQPTTLGGVIKSGIGDRTMILIPGLGFGGQVFDDLTSAYADKFRTYAVTLPGFGGTPAHPCPPESTSFSAQTWTNSALAGIEKLIADEHLQNIVVVGHWLVGTQLAARLAINHPEKVSAVVLLTGAPLANFATDTNYAKYYDTYEKRIATMDKFMGARWFKFVTQETWDDNNFFPTDYAVHPVMGLRLWREAARPPLHVWIRYLCEFESQELTRDIGRLKVPTLILNPGYEGLWYDGSNNYMVNTFGSKGWGSSLDGMANVEMKTIPNSRACMWVDQPKAVQEAMSSFLDRLH
jgi:pimeloyl-ACP methyl ester carboxylesterase